MRNRRVQPPPGHFELLTIRSRVSAHTPKSHKWADLAAVERKLLRGPAPRHAARAHSGACGARRTDVDMAWLYTHKASTGCAKSPIPGRIGRISRPGGRRDRPAAPRRRPHAACARPAACGPRPSANIGPVLGTRGEHAGLENRGEELGGRVGSVGVTFGLRSHRVLGDVPG